MISFLKNCIQFVLLQILINSLFLLLCGSQTCFQVSGIRQSQNTSVVSACTPFQALWIRRPPASLLCFYLSLDLVLQPSASCICILSSTFLCLEVHPTAGNTSPSERDASCTRLKQHIALTFHPKKGSRHLSCCVLTVLACSRILQHLSGISIDRQIDPLVSDIGNSCLGLLCSHQHAAIHMSSVAL